MELHPTATLNAIEPRPKKKPWWVTTRGLRSSIALFVVWAALCVLRIVNLKAQHDWWHIGIIVIGGILALAYAAAIVFWIRNRPVPLTSTDETPLS